MRLPVMPPVAPMLAKPIEDIPTGPFSFEPKWDGFRSIVFRDGEEVEIGSRNERPMTRYFPEVVDAIKANLPERCVVDGEVVVPDPAGRRLEFETLQQRIHPADSRVMLLAERTPAHFVAFDLLALGNRDFTREPFARRRRTLEEALAGAASPIHITPATTDREVARRWFRTFEGAGLDGLIAKPLDGTYQPGKRVMFKIKHVRTADCVVAGYRVYRNEKQAVGSLLLGLYDEQGELANVGVVGAFPMEQRRRLFKELQPLVTTFDQHPWDWAKLEPGRANPPQRRNQPLERRKGSLLRAAATRTRRRGPLRPHGGAALQAHYPVRPLAHRPRPTVLHLRPAPGAGPLRPRRHSGLVTPHRPLLPCAPWPISRKCGSSTST